MGVLHGLSWRACTTVRFLWCRRGPQRAVTACALALVLVPIVLGSVVPDAWAKAQPDVVIRGCRIVTHPMLRHYTVCPKAKFGGADLRKRDLAFADLAGANLSRAKLFGADLSNANLSGVVIAGADLSYANLSQDYLSGLDLTGTTLAGADLAGVDLLGQDLTKFNLNHANLLGAYLTKTTLTDVTWVDTTCPDGSKSAMVGGSCDDDLLVLQGQALGSASNGSGPPPVGNEQASTAAGPSPVRTQLPLTGAPHAMVALIGLALVIAGLLLIRRSKARFRG